MTDPLDMPDEEEWALVVPFVVCTSQGGPYDDDSFVAGFQAGQIDQALAVLSVSGGDRYHTTVRTALMPLLELIAMNRGFGTVTAGEVTDTDDHPALPEWTYLSISRGEDL